MLKSFASIAFGFALFVSVNCACSDYVVGANSGVVCVSQTEFVFEDGITKGVPPAANTLIDPLPYKGQCPIGTVCADVPGACADPAVEPAICENGLGICGSCAGTTMACVTQTEFSFCSGGVLVGSRHKCLAGKYCQVKDISKAVSPCLATTKSDATCKATVATPGPTTNATQPATEPTTAPAAFSCAGRALGTYAATTDTTCRQYYYCYSENNAVQLRSYWCSASTVFNPTTKKCVASSLYKCTNV